MDLKTLRRCVKNMARRNRLSDQEVNAACLRFRSWFLGNALAKSANLDNSPVLRDIGLLKYLFRFLLLLNVTLNSKLKDIIDSLKAQFMGKLQYVVLGDSESTLLRLMKWLEDIRTLVRWKKSRKSLCRTIRIKSYPIAPE